MDNKSQLNSVPLLSGKENYCAWALAIKGAAMWGGFWEHYIDPTVLQVAKPESTTDPATTSNETTDPPRTTKTTTTSAEVQKLEMKAIGALIMTTVPVIQMELDTLKPQANEIAVTAWDLWFHLKSKYETRDSVSALLDYKKFIHAMLSDDGTLEDLLNRHYELHSRCAMNNFTVPDWQYAALILLALPDSYSHIQETFLMTGLVKDLKPDEVRARIIETKICQKENGTAFSLSTQTPAKQKKSGNITSSSSPFLFLPRPQRH